MSETENKIPKTEAQWRQKLSDEQYRVCREKGTEQAFSGEYWDSKEEGMYRCAGCGEPLFSSQTKYDSGCAGPVFMRRRIRSVYPNKWIIHRA
jgi:peptide-methionine (R)-S-oxide reductase